MRPILLLIFLLFALHCYSAKPEVASKDSGQVVELVEKNVITQLKLPTIRQLESQAGRKLSLREKIGYYLIKSKLRKAEPSENEVKNANSNAVLGFVFACLSLFVIQLFAIPALILAGKALRAEKVSPGILTRGNKSLARAAQIISYVSLVLLFIALILILAFLGAWGGR